MADDPQIAFITYTKGAAQYVTSPMWETKFLNWLAKHYNTSDYTRQTHTTVGILVAPFIVHSKEQKSATVLKLVKDQEPQ